jgi:hypothetical protein
MSGYLADKENCQKKCAYAAYKTAVSLQVYFGEQTLNKRKLLDLYMCNIPPFELKHIGEYIIRTNIGSYYPDNPPKYLEPEYYINSIQSAYAILL